jgi:hypothetical protein
MPTAARMGSWRHQLALAACDIKQLRSRNLLPPATGCLLLLAFGRPRPVKSTLPDREPDLTSSCCCRRGASSSAPVQKSAAVYIISPTAMKPQGNGKR